MKTINDALIPNTFQIPARCKVFEEPTTVDELRQALHRWRSSASLPLLIMGRGSNLLFTKDFEGHVIHPDFRGISYCQCDSEHIVVRVGAGEEWDGFVAYCVSHGWHGAENLSLIPGDVGAAAVQNIGAYGVEVKDIILSVEVIEVATGEHRLFDKEACGYAYRQSRFKQEWHNCYVVTHVNFRLSKRFTPKLDYGNIRAELEARHISSPTAYDIRNVVISIRKTKLPDPMLEGNAGSFFMNPVVERSHYLLLKEKYPDIPCYEVDAGHVKIPAGWLIEQCGWKGRSLGRAGVHDRQALVLVNRGGATGAEVLQLCNIVQTDVRRMFGIDIHPEVNIF